MPKKIPLTRGLFAVVDDSDYEWLNKWKWHAMPNGRSFYACRRQRPSETGLPKRLTRIVWMHKQIDPNCKDHRDRDGLNNQRANLRPATKNQNAANSAGHRDSKSGIKGVIPFREKWRAEIMCNGVHRHLGVFQTKEEAANAYSAAAVELFGEYARNG